MTLALAAIRAAVVLAVALAAMRLLARTSAATRRSVLVGAFALVLVLPIATAVLPALHLRGEVSPEAQAPVATVVPEPIDEAGPLTDVAITLHAPQADAPAVNATREV